ncbi:MAG: hypothetical protein IMZ50_09550 [Candidatus Atribacteria bacterium]|nr:hypothetical protein [Candidatus Atribacteria bacterium]
MSTKPIKCFVAMPFGRQDCDTLYDRHIYPVLRDLGILPIRVDKREHKEDLNNYIIRMLDESDIALADLTYARPSVYYEAGYAERKIPVIYTARKDHLSRSQADDNLRVHFDLEMKKIVHWASIDDPTFEERLNRRVSFFIKPLRSQQAQKDELEKDRKAFISKSVLARIDEISQHFERTLRNRGFWICPLSDMSRYYQDLISPVEVLIGSKMVNKTCYLCVVSIADTLRKKQIQTAVKKFTGTRIVMSDYEIDNYEEHHYFLTLHQFPEARIASILPDAVPCESAGIYSIDFVGEIPYFERVEDEHGMVRIVTPAKIKRRKIIRIISPVDMRRTLDEEATKCATTFPDGKINRFAFLIKGTDIGTYGYALNKIKLSKTRRPGKPYVKYPMGN